jgi:hypothetical protein
MAGLSERLTGQGSGPWLDYIGYAGKLLAGGKVPWTAVDGAMAWLRQSQGLLRSSVVPVPVATIAAAWLDQNPGLRTEMAAKSRTIFPLRTLLADPGLRGHLRSLVEATGASMSSLPLVAVIPSPRVWVGLAYDQAFPGSEVDVDEDAIDSAASYIADFLRELPQTVVAGVLLDESAAAEPLSTDTTGLYQPIFNIANHYRWQVGILAPQAGNGAAIAAAAAAAPDFWITAEPVVGKTCGAIVGAAFWTGEAAPARPDGGFLYAAIPADAQPEAVLERLASLR